MDSFEVRVQFTNRLKKLGASRDSILKVANFAMEHLEHHEDLFNCTIEQLSSTSVRNRLNLLCLIDTLCQIAVSSTSIGSSVITIEPALINSAISTGKKTKPEMGDPSPENRATEDTALKRKVPTKHTTPTEIPTSGNEIENLSNHQNNPSIVDSKKLTGINSQNPFPLLVQTHMTQIFEYAVPKDSKGALNLSGARKGRAKPLVFFNHTGFHFERILKFEDLSKMISFPMEFQWKPIEPMKKSLDQWFLLPLSSVLARPYLFMTSKSILTSWRSKNLFPLELIEAIEQSLKNHQFEESKEPAFSRSEIFRRIEEDRERHKRMKEENWIQPSEASERREFEELYDCLEQPSLESLLDTLDQLHARFLYDTTFLGKV